MTLRAVASGGGGAAANVTVGTSLIAGGTDTYVLYNNNGTLGNASTLRINATAGQGPSVVAGTATTDVNALTVTRTNNNALVTTGVSVAITDTSSATTAQHFKILGGTTGSVNFLSVGKDSSSFTAGIKIGEAGGTSQGFYIGNFGSGYSALWQTSVTPGATNYTLYSGGSNAGDISLNTGAAGGILTLRAANVAKLTMTNTAGRAIDIAGGTAVTDVQALAVTQTWNEGSTAFTMIKANATSTASAAGALLMDLQTGGGTQFSVRKDGLITTGGTAGVATFGPSVVTSITVKNGIITAIS